MYFVHRVFGHRALSKPVLHAHMHHVLRYKSNFTRFTQFTIKLDEQLLI